MKIVVQFAPVGFWSPDGFALTPRRLAPLRSRLKDYLALELRDSGEDVEYKLPGRGGRIDVLRPAVDFDAQILDASISSSRSSSIAVRGSLCDMYVRVWVEGVSGLRAVPLAE